MTRNYSVVHHTVTNQNKTNPRHPALAFYNVVISPTEVVRRSEKLHPRGNNISSYDIGVIGDFRTDKLTGFQERELKKELDRKGFEVVGHSELKSKGATIGRLTTVCPSNLMNWINDYRKAPVESDNKNRLLSLLAEAMELVKKL